MSLAPLLTIIKNPKATIQTIMAAITLYKTAKPIVQDLTHHSGEQGSMKLRPVAELRTRVTDLQAEVHGLRRRITLMNLAIFGNASVAVTALVLAILWN